MGSVQFLGSITLLGKEKVSANSETISFEGFQFPSLRLYGEKFYYKGLSFVNCTFAGNVSIELCIFAQGISFKDTKFNGPVYFRDVHISNVRFASPFGKKEEEGDGPRKQPNGVFDYATFSSGVTFYKVIFGGTGFFQRTIFEGETHFQEVTFHGQNSSGEYYGAAYFLYADFKGSVRFLNCVFKVKSLYAQTTFHGNAIFTDCAFREIVSFEKSTFEGQTVFEIHDLKRGFNDEVNFRNVKVGEKGSLTFSRVSLFKASFLDTNLESIVFRDVIWYRPPSRVPFLQVRKAALYDEFRPHPDKDSKDLSDQLLMLEEIRETFPKILENYHQLVLNYQKKRDFYTAEDFYVGEMEMQEKMEPLPLNKFTLFKWLSFYNTSVRHALGVLALLLFVLATLFLYSGFSITEPGQPARVVDYYFTLDKSRQIPLPQVLADYGNALLFSFSFIPSISASTYEPVGWFSRLILYLGALCIAGQSILVGSAVRRRLQR